VLAGACCWCQPAVPTLRSSSPTTACTRIP
jgi:hypothetical protein